MTDSSSFNSAFEGKSPLELGKSTIDELFAEYKDSLSDLTFISTCGIKCELNIDGITPPMISLIPSDNNSFLLFML